MPEQERVPVRIILASIGLVLATIVLIWLLLELAHIIALLLVAAFFAIVLTPAVDLVSRRFHIRRGLATGIVFLVGLALVSAMLYAFIRPLVEETTEAIDSFPTFLADAREGRGTIGDLVERYDLERRYQENQGRIQEAITGASDRVVNYAGRIVSGIIAMLTVFVLTVMMILYGPHLLSSGLGTLPPRRRARVKAVASDCAKALSGYVLGNVVISLIAGLVTFLALSAFGVPFRGVLALWTGFADLIPLVGATLGAIPTIGVSFLHSVPAGIGMLVFYAIYQQFENNVLQPWVMARTVQINQLFVLVSVLVGVELFGLLGALLAIPLAGVISVVVRDLWDNRTWTWKEQPTVGEDEIPVDTVIAAEHPDLGIGPRGEGKAGEGEVGEGEAGPGGPADTDPATAGDGPDNGGGS